MENIIKSLLPEISIAITLFLILINSLIDHKHFSKSNSMLIIFGIFISIFFLLNQSGSIYYMNEALVNNEFTKAVKILILASSLVSICFISKKNDELYSKIVGEYSLLLVMSMLGALITISAREFFTLILGLELMSIPIYLMTAMGPKGNIAVEGATKLFFFGTLSTVLIIFSAVLNFGMTNSTLISFDNSLSSDVLSILSFFFFFLSICFKTGLIPMHFWLSDTYQSAPSNILPYLSTIPKIAVISLLISLVSTEDLYDNIPYIKNIIIIFSLSSIIYGSILTLKQKNLFRLLAYSGIPHAGMMILFSILNMQISYSFILIYFTFYIFSNLCLYSSISNFNKNQFEFYVEDLKGLYKDSPFLSIIITISVLSLAGVPLTAGFWGKFNIVILMYQEYGIFYPSIILAGAAIGFFYYLKLIRFIFSDKNINSLDKFDIELEQKLILSVCIAIILLIGLNPNLIDILSRF